MIWIRIAVSSCALLALISAFVGVIMIVEAGNLLLLGASISLAIMAVILMALDKIIELLTAIHQASARGTDQTQS